MDVSAAVRLEIKGDTGKESERRGRGRRGFSIHHLFHAGALRAHKGQEQQKAEEQVKQFHLLCDQKPRL